MKKLSIVTLAALCAVSYCQVLTPPTGSTTRKSIMDSLRPSVEKMLGIKVIFKVIRVNTYHSYCFVEATPLQANGKEINYLKTKQRKEYLLEKDVSFGEEVAAIMKSSGHSWKMVKFYHNYSDLPWADAPREYGLPSQLFGLTN